jgi:hypothetical protein
MLHYTQMSSGERNEKTTKKIGGARPGSGMKPGQKTAKTIERDAARKAYQQLVLERLRPIFEKQMSLVNGVAYLYRIEETRHGGKEHVLVTNPDDIGDVLAQMDGWEGQVVNDQYYYVTVRPPENAAIKDMLDRALGKATQMVAGDPDGAPIVTVIKYAHGDKTTPPLQS